MPFPPDSALLLLRSTSGERLAEVCFRVVHRERRYANGSYRALPSSSREAQLLRELAEATDDLALSPMDLLGRELEVLGVELIDEASGCTLVLGTDFCGLSISDDATVFGCRLMDGATARRTTPTH